MEPNDVDKILNDLGFDRSDFDQPSTAQMLEAMRTGLALVKMTNAGDYAGILRYWSGLDSFEKGYAVGALSQLGLAGVYALAACNDLSLDGQLARMEAEIAAGIQDGQG